MSNLGALYYTLNLKDLTEQDLQKINARLKDLGADVTLNPKILKESVQSAMPTGITLDITPNKVAQEALDNAIAGKAMHAEILPLTDKLKTAVVDALRDLQIPLNGLTIPPDKISAAVQTALTSANFTSVGDKAGDELAKAIRVKVEGQRYEATITAKVDKLTDTVNKALDKIFAKEQKIKLDRSDIRAFRDELKTKIGESVKVAPTLNVTQEALQRAVEGKVMRVEIAPLMTNLRTTIKNAFNGNPAEIEIAPMQTKLRNLINTVLQKQGYMVNISTVTGLEKSINTHLNGRIYNVKIRANASEIANSVQASLMQVQSRHFGLQVSKDILRQSIDTALMGKPFNIQIAVMHDQARRAVQNALNNARMVGKDDALAFQRLQTGELKAAQAELARLKAAHQGAASAANAHASASINLGGALGSNIKIAGELGAAMASLYSIHAAKQFLSQVIEIGGELEHQKIALETIYGSESKMESLYGQIKGLARQSPFGVMELTKNIKQLSAYGVAYNEVYDTAKRLADISAATSVDIQRLILAFGKTKNRTFLDGLEAKQFAYANIPIYDMLSKKLTELEGKFVSVKDVMGRIKKREIGFDMVKDILWDMTDEGGKFYNMQEKLAGSVKTSWKLVRDNIELMFGEIAEGGIGDFLKNIGQTLQEVTRSWKALSTVIAVGGGAFAVYKLAVMGTNVLLEKQVGSLVANHLAEKQVQAAKLRSIGLTGTLSARERELIATRKRLTATDLEYLFVEKGLATDEIKRLYLTGKITRAELQKAVALGVVTQKEFEQIAGTKALNGVWLRFKATVTGTWATIKSGVGAAFGMIFNWTTAAFAAIAGITYLIQHNMRENEIADNFSKTWKQKGEDMAKELDSSLSKPFENLSAPQATELINEYKNLIKDFASLPEDVIQRAIYDKDGNIRNTADQIKYLREELEALKDTAQSMSQDMGTIVGATGDGWFKEDVVTNLKDYSDAYNKANAVYLKFVTDHKDKAQTMVDVARNADAAFAQEIANAKTLVEQFSILMRERTNFPDAWKAAENEVGKWATRGGSIFGSFGFLVGKTTPFEASLAEMRKYKQAMEDVRAAMDGFWDSHSGQEGWDWVELKESQAEEVRQFYKQLIEAAEISSPELKQVVADEFQDMFNVKIIPDKTEEKWIENARKAMGACTDEATKEALRVMMFDGADKLTEEQKNLIRKLFSTADDETKKQLPELFENAQSWINQHELFWRIQFFMDNNSGQLSQAMQDIIRSKGGTSKLSATTTDILKEIDGEGKSIYDIRNALQERRQKAKNVMDAAIKGGLKEDTESYKQAKKDFEESEKAIKELDWTDLITKDQKSNKGPKETKKDEVAENLKQRFKDIKDAWSEFQKWSKTEGRDAAAIRIGESGLFPTLPKEKIPQTIAQYRALVVELEDELKAAGIEGHTQRESLLNEMLKQLLDIDKTVVDEQLKLALDAVSKEAERQLADWNLFDKIRKATGNQDLAMSIAFGFNADAETDYPALVKKQFADLAKSQGFDLTFDNTTLKEAKEFGDAIEKSYQDTANKLEQYARQQKDAIESIVSEYQSLQDKLTKIDADRERKIKTVKESDMSDADKAKYIQRINVEADYQKFQQSNEYLRFFNDIYGLTMSEANKIGDLIQLNLNQKLQAGLISIYDYEKEMEKVRKQLETLRNVKSDALTFLTGGFKGLNEKKLREEEGKLANNEGYKKALEEQIAAQNALNAAQESGDAEAIRAAEEQLNAATEAVKVYTKVRDAIIKDQQNWQNALDIFNIIGVIAHGVSDAFDSIRDMADSFGFDADSNAWNTIGATLDSMTTVVDGASKILSSLLNGDIGGMISGVFDTLLTPFTIWNKLHDKKLQKDIENSKKRYDQYDRLLTQIERRLANHLGGYNDFDPMPGTKYGKDGAFGYEREMKKKQLEELKRQQADMEAMKKKDPEAIAEIQARIGELTDEIAQLQIEAANAIYGIDIAGWAETIGDALWDAFMKGEDALEAFDKAVADIMSDVVKNVLKVNVLERAFQDVRDWLASESGPMSNGILDMDEAGEMWRRMQDSAKKGMDSWNAAMDAMPEDMMQFLKDNYDTKSKSGMTAGLQALTEDTGDLLASYFNAFRGDASAIRGYIETYLDSTLPQMNVIAESQLQAQRQIAENTLRNAIAAEMILKSSDNIYRLLSRVSQGGAKFYIQ